MTFPNLKVYWTRLRAVAEAGSIASNWVSCFGAHQIPQYENSSIVPKKAKWMQPPSDSPIEEAPCTVHTYP